jgi:hypothetical protein
LRTLEVHFTVVFTHAHPASAVADIAPWGIVTLAERGVVESMRLAVVVATVGAVGVDGFPRVEESTMLS